MANIERLQMMANLLERIDREERLSNAFDLDGWTGGTDGSLDSHRVDEIQYGSLKLGELLEGRTGESDLVEAVAECGTTACACGYAGLAPEFRALGFFTTPYGMFFEDKYDWDAVQSFFEIGYIDAAYLFLRDAYPDDLVPTPADVRERVLSLIARETEVLA